jgi:hypothetical protein
MGRERELCVRAPNAALIAAGVPEDRITEAIEWARSKMKGELVDAFGDLVRQNSRSTSKLKALGRDFIKATGGGFSDDALAEMDLPDGAEWFRDQQNRLCVRINGWGQTTAQAAIRQGVLRFKAMIDFNDPRYISRYTPAESTCLYDTVTQSFVLDREGKRIRVDRQTGKRVAEIVRCPTCGGAVKKNK